MRPRGSLLTVGHMYTVGGTPQKAWRRVPLRGFWFVAALGFASVAALALRADGPSLAADTDSPLVLAPMAVAIIFALLAACAAYRARMMGRFADENPEAFAAHPEPAAEAAAEAAGGLFADPLAPAPPASVAPAAPVRQFCPYCGGRIQLNHAFCMFCGVRLPNDTPQ
jgi:hypothetical protein